MISVYSVTDGAELYIGIVPFIYQGPPQAHDHPWTGEGGVSDGEFHEGDMRKGPVLNRPFAIFRIFHLQMVQ